MLEITFFLSVDNNENFLIHRKCCSINLVDKIGVFELFDIDFFVV